MECFNDNQGPVALSGFLNHIYSNSFNNYLLQSPGQAWRPAFSHAIVLYCFIDHWHLSQAHHQPHGCCAVFSESTACALHGPSEIKLTRDCQGKKWTKVSIENFLGKERFMLASWIKKQKLAAFLCDTFNQRVRGYCPFVAWLEWELVLAIQFPNGGKLILNI